VWDAVGFGGAPLPEASGLPSPNDSVHDVIVPVSELLCEPSKLTASGASPEVGTFDSSATAPVVCWAVNWARSGARSAGVSCEAPLEASLRPGKIAMSRHNSAMSVKDFLMPDSLVVWQSRSHHPVIGVFRVREKLRLCDMRVGPVTIASHCHH
jgi:hypothetical protein